MMNILVVVKLSDGKIHSKFKPFEENDLISKIYLLRDFPYKLSCLSKIRNVNVKGTGYFRHLRKIAAGFRLTKHQRIDVIISYLLSPHGYLAWALSLLTGKPWIHCVIDGDAEFWGKGKLFKFFHLFIIRRATKVVIMGEKTKEYLIKKGLAESKIAIIPNIIDINFFNPIFDAPKNYDIVYVGRIDQNKNLTLLVDAIEHAQKEFPNIQVAIAGDGPDKQNIMNQVEAKGLSDNFSFLGYIESNQVSSFLAQGRLFVLTSMHEGFPLALFEAMASGLVCISADVGEIGSFVIDGENGFLINDFKDATILSNKIIELLGNDELREAVSQNAIRSTREYAAHDVQKLWNDILTNKAINTKIT